MPRAAKTKSSSKSARKPLPEALSSKMIKLFSEEVEFLLAPPPAIKGRIETLYSSERRITTEDGTIHDEAVRLCSADGAMWITRVKGDPQFFKRLEEKNAFKQIKDADDVGRKSVSKAKSKTRASKKRNNDEEEFGVPDIFEKTSTARQKYASAPGAVPARDHKKDQKWEDDEELRERVREALNRKEFGTEEERIGFDDLASLSVPLFQVPFLQPTPRWDQDETGTGKFSQWARETKKQFLHDLSKNKAKDWQIVIGNEGGDLDSMVSALSWAYHLSHQPKPEKAIALLQTENDALDLRPENKLALHYARMASRHRDLLTIDELPIKPFDLYHRIKGLALVDHNSPRAYWGNATILSIIDHHDDLKLAPDASPRVIETSASCSSLVTRTIFEETAKSEELGVLTKGHKAMPVELAELLLRTIAIDSGGLKKRGAKRDVDEDMAEKLLKLSSWKGRKLRNVMKLIGKDLLEAKRSLDTLDLRDLLRRDWKGDAVPTRSDKYPTISIGFASIPVSMNEQVLRTPEQSPPEWFAVERAYTSEVGVDVSVVLSNYRNRDGKKVHEIALVVAHGLGKRLHEKSADRLFKQLKEGIESAKELEGLEEWKRPDGKKLLPRRAVWRHYSDEAGRKLIRPIMERSVRKWKG